MYIAIVVESNIMLKNSDQPWIKEDEEAPDTPLDNVVLNRSKQFRTMNQFKKAALRVTLSYISKSMLYITSISIKNIMFKYDRR